MCRIVLDFIKSADCRDGFGYFASNLIAIRYAQTLSRSQKRKYNRYGIIPIAFFNYLEKVEVIKLEKFIPEKHRTVFLLLDLLWETRKRSQLDSSEGECIRVEILLELMPWLRKSLGTAEHMWEKLQLYNAEPL